MREDRHPRDEREDAVRALLAGLGDPGPMPDDVVRRIQARLEVERAHRERDSEEVVVVPLRRRHRAATWLLAGAAAAVAVAVGGDLLVSRSQDNAASLQSATQPAVGHDTAGGDAASKAQRDAAAPEVAADAAGSTAAAAAEGAEPASAALTILPHLGHITADPAALASRLAATNPAGSPSLTVAQADWCRASLPEGARGRPTTWARARWSDDDVVVAVSGLGAGQASAVVLPADCATGQTVDPVVAPFSLPSP